MNEPSPQSLEAAFRLIDSITRLKGILGAMLVDRDGKVVAQDFLSPDQSSRCTQIATQLLPELDRGTAELEFGEIGDIVFQMKKMTLRFVRQENVWLAVFAGDNANVGMLNVELRSKQDQMKVIAGGSVAAERDMQKQHIVEVLRAEGSIKSLIEERAGDIAQLRGLHGIMFQVALESGVSRDTISRRINDINYKLYRDSLLDIGFDFFNRKALDNYDPSLARKVMREQIAGLAQMVLPNLKGS